MSARQNSGISDSSAPTTATRCGAALRSGCRRSESSLTCPPCLNLTSPAPRSLRRQPQEPKPACRIRIEGYRNSQGDRALRGDQEGGMGVSQYALSESPLTGTAMGALIDALD